MQELIQYLHQGSLSSNKMIIQLTINKMRIKRFIALTLKQSSIIMLLIVQ